jgi:hypothetical protein
MRLGIVVCAAALLCSLGANRARGWHKLPSGREGFYEAGYAGVRGITVGPIESSQWSGRGYGTAASAGLLDELARMGASWVSVTPFGRAWSLRSTAIRAWTSRRPIWITARR